MSRIYLELDVSKVNKLCAICESMDCDINVLCGRVCVDGKSVMGVAQFCGRVVTLAPVTDDDYIYETFYKKVKDIGAYKGGEF